MLTTRVPMTHRDGRLRWMKVAMRLMRDEEGMPQSLIGALADITDQCRAETLCGEFDRFIGELADHPGRVLCFSIDNGEQKRVIYARTMAGLGIPGDDRAGEVPPEVLDALAREAQAPRSCAMVWPAREMEHVGVERREAEFRMVTPIGQERWIREVWLPLSADPARLPKLVMGMMSDITAEKARNHGE